MTRTDIREWIYLLESSLALSSWLKSDSIDRADLEHRITQVENDIEEIHESLFQRQIRRYMKLFKKMVRREKGSGLDLVKFHQLLHIFKYVLHHGSLANCDGSRPEAVGKFLIKNPGRRTQIRLSVLTIQTAAKMVQQRNIHDFAKICLRKDPSIFNSKKLHKFYMFSDMSTDESEDDSMDISDDNSDGDDEESYSEDTDMIVNGRGQYDAENSIGRKSKKYYDLSGSVFELYISGIDERMKINWLSKVKYRNLWKASLLRGVERRLFHEIGRAGGTINLTKSIVGRTCLSVVQSNKTKVRYNAHPNYRSGLPWYDWVMLDWGTDGKIPARLFMILETTNLEDSDIIHFGNEPIPQENLDNQTSLLKANSIFLVIQSARKDRENHNENRYKYSSRLSYHVTLEDEYAIVNVSCLHGPAYAVANAPFGNEGNAEDIKDFIIVEDMKDWSKIFINRENIESFGPTRA